MVVRTRVNGEWREAEVWPGSSLLSLLRDGFGLYGAKNACEQGECGSCSVWLDGALVCSCLVLAGQAQEREVRTVEGLRDGTQLHNVQAGICRRRCRPVWILYPRLRRRSRRLAGERSKSKFRDDQGSAERKPLPLHRLPEDRRRRQPGGDALAGADMILIDGLRAVATMDDAGTELEDASI